MRANRILPVIALLLAACSGERTADKPESSASGAPAAQPPAAAPSTADAVASLPAETQVPFRTMMASYASIHASLAGDSTVGVAAAATAVKTSARELEAISAEPLKSMYTSVATEGENLAANSAELTTARKNFGELSKSVIRVLVANPSLAKGYVVVECPMTGNYKKWLQTDETVRNPHYGSSMLECGTVTKLEL